MVTRSQMHKNMRPELHLFYVLDTSGSMHGRPISVLNYAMTATIDALRVECKHNMRADVKVAVLEFNSNCRWISPAGPESLEDFWWEDLSAGGGTYMGTALDELNSKLSLRSFLHSPTGNLLPVIIFMTDGFSPEDYRPALERLSKNKWYRYATKIGFCIGGNPDVEMIARLTGNSETVLRTKVLRVFASMMRWASVTASRLASQPRLNGGDVAIQSVNEAKRLAGVTDEQVAAGIDYKDPILISTVSASGVLVTRGTVTAATKTRTDCSREVW